VPYLIEEGIRPLVDALNQLSYVSTVYSCEGHFDAPPDERFLPTAYVTFDVNEPARFQPLYRELAAFSNLLGNGFIQLTYDCFLGRYTLSTWAEPHLRDPQRKRESVRALVEQLAKLIADQKETPEGEVRRAGPYPCESPDPPCALTLPAGPIRCPFMSPPRGGMAGDGC
jgi:hypothetical protein